MKQKIVEQIQVSAQDVGARLDVFLVGQLEGLSRAQVQKLVRDGAVQVDGKKVKTGNKLVGGQVVTIDGTVEDPEPSHLTPKVISLDVLYEDAHVIVIHKQAGLVVHPGAGDTGPTLAEGLLYHCQTIDAGHPLRPGIVHRLDKDTSGVLVCAKTQEAHRVLSQQFKEKSNYREYLALMNGVLEAETVVVEGYLTRDPKNRMRYQHLSGDMVEPAGESDAGTPEKGGARLRWAKSTFKVEGVYGHRLTLAKVVLATGRTHQIRVHSASLKAPVLGDKLYGNVPQLPTSFAPEVRHMIEKQPRQLLHASKLGFKHPATGKEVEFSAPLPDDFQHLMDVLQPYRMRDK